MAFDVFEVGAVVAQGSMVGLRSRSFLSSAAAFLALDMSPAKEKTVPADWLRR